MALPHDFTTEPLTAAALMETLDYLLARAVAAGSSEGVLTRLVDVRAEAGELRFITEEGAVLASVPHSPFSDRGPWQPDTAYVPGDLVLAQGARYLAQTAHVSAASLAEDVAAGRMALLLPAAEPGAVGVLRGPYDVATAYAAFDLVIQGGQVWQSLADNNQGQLVSDDGWWTPVGVRLEGFPRYLLSDAGRVLSPQPDGSLQWQALTLAQITDVPDPTPADAGRALVVGADQAVSWQPLPSPFPADAAGVLSNDGAGVLSWAPVATVPPGTSVPFRGLVLPQGWLWEDGRSVSRASYPALLSALCAYWPAGGSVSALGDLVMLPPGQTVPLDIDPAGAAIEVSDGTLTELVLINQMTALQGGATTGIGVATQLSAALRGASDVSVRLLPYGAADVDSFQLPDSRGRVSLGYGDASGLTPRRLGESGGEEVVTLTEAQIPAHTHTAVAYQAGTDTTTGLPSWGRERVDPPLAGEGLATRASGGDQGHENMPPYLVARSIIYAGGVS